MTNKKMILLLISAFLLAGGIFLYYNFGSILTRTAERIATNALGVNVSISSIHVSLSDKEVTVNNINIANPPGYRKSNAITTDRIVIGLNNANKELIDFKDIQVKGSVVNLEVNEHGMNLVDLKNLAQSKKQTDSAGSKQIRVIVKHMVIESSVINPSITLLDRDIPSINMPPITFNNLGQGGGMNADKAIVQVLSKYLTAVEKQARQEGMLNGIKMPSNLNDVEKTIDDAAGSLKKLFN